MISIEIQSCNITTISTRLLYSIYVFVNIPLRVLALRGIITPPSGSEEFSRCSLAYRVLSDMYKDHLFYFSYLYYTRNPSYSWLLCYVDPTFSAPTLLSFLVATVHLDPPYVMLYIHRVGQLQNFLISHYQGK